MNFNIQGRNHNTIIEESERIIFRKELIGEKEDKLRRYINLERWDWYNKNILDILSPSIVHKNKEKFEIDYEYLDNGINLQEYFLKREEYSQTDMEKILLSTIEIVARINSIKNKENIEPIDHIGLIRMINFIDPKSYCYASGAELEFLTLIHQDEILRRSFNEKINYLSENLPHRLVHGDIRFDQFIIDQNSNVWITDFEEFHLGNAYKDISNLLGSILFQFLLDTFSFSDFESITSADIDAQIMARGQDNLIAAGKIMNKLYSKYKDMVDTNLDVSGLSFFIGVFIFERLESRAKFSYKMSAIDKAIAGIARQLIINEEFIASIFDE